METNRSHAFYFVPIRGPHRSSQFRAFHQGLKVFKL